MFNIISKYISSKMIKKKLITEKNLSVCEYAMEVIMLNSLLLLILLSISLLLGQGLFFVCYIIFFVPLRMFSGGYHSKRSEVCLVLSVTLYMVGIVFVNIDTAIFVNKIIIILALICSLFMFEYAPVVNPGRPLSSSRITKIRSMVRKIIFINIILFVICYKFNSIIASYEIVFTLLNGALFAFGVLENRISSKGF